MFNRYKLNLKSLQSIAVVCICLTIISCSGDPANQGSHEKSKSGLKQTAAPEKQDQSSSLFPKAVGWINDFEAVFSPEEEAQLVKEIEALKKRNGAEIAIVTLDANYTDFDHFDEYSLQLAQHWKIGEKEKNNGMLIAFSKSLHKIRIQNGIGLEKMITNEETQQIIDQFIVPSFKQEAYFQGTLDGLKALINELEKG